MIMLRVGIQVKPPLLQTYTLPSGPIAAPFGPPGICAMISLRPSGQTRVSLWPRISTSRTLPSGIATGPSGNCRSVARTRTLGIGNLPPDVLSRSGSVPHAQDVLAQIYGKVASACQASAAIAGQRCVLFADRHPDLEPAIAGRRIEFLVIALEIGRIGGLEAGVRQPVIPDRVDGTTDARNVVAMGEYRVSL